MELEMKLELLRRIKDHEIWVETEGGRGSQLNLTGRDVSDSRGVFLGRNLSKAILVGTDLTGEVLIGTSFEGANLTGATLVRTELRDCSFRESKIGGASFNASRDLDLSGALGIEDAEFKNLKT